MEIYKDIIWEVALKDNYNDRCPFSTYDEAMDFIIKTGKPEKYILTRTYHTRVFDDAGVFHGDKTETHRVGFIIFEVWKSDEMGHDYHVKSFHDINDAFDYINKAERSKKGWHFRHIEKHY